MKFIKSDLTKKLIIILIVLLLFNAVYPIVTYAAVDFGGILLQPLAWLILAVAVPVDLAISAIIKDMNTSNIAEDATRVIDKAGTNSDINHSLFVDIDHIFTGMLPTFNANIFKPKADSTLEGVRETVAKFYVILRNICATVMLAGLIFTGIQILLSANIPTKKTQYLMLLQDWLIGMALLIFSHIVMILIFEMTDALSESLTASIMSGRHLKVTLLKNLLWSWEGATIVINMILYLYSIWLVICFAVAYYKRFFWTCILVIFAPIMTVMYAFGQQTKQIYSNWLKEFILNAFVQPFHIIVYSVLLGIPATFVTEMNADNFNSIPTLVYCLMAISMIRPAEKYLRRLFGMDKGIANMASADSGAQDIKNFGKAVASVAKTAVAVGATVATGGAAAGMMGAAGAGAEAGAGTGAGIPGLPESQGVTDMLGGDGGTENFLDALSPSEDFSENNMLRYRFR